MADLEQIDKPSWRKWCDSEGHFPLGGIFREERHFLLFKDQLVESERQKTKENIISHGKLRLVDNGPNGYIGIYETSGFSYMQAWTTKIHSPKYIHWVMEEFPIQIKCSIE